METVSIYRTVEQRGTSAKRSTSAKRTRFTARDTDTEFSQITEHASAPPQVRKKIGPDRYQTDRLKSPRLGSPSDIATTEQTGSDSKVSSATALEDIADTVLTYNTGVLMNTTNTDLVDLSSTAMVLEAIPAQVPTEYTGIPDDPGDDKSPIVAALVNSDSDIDTSSDDDASVLNTGKVLERRGDKTLEALEDTSSISSMDTRMANKNGAFQPMESDVEMSQVTGQTHNYCPAPTVVNPSGTGASSNTVTRTTRASMTTSGLRRKPREDKLLREKKALEEEKAEFKELCAEAAIEIQQGLDANIEREQELERKRAEVLAQESRALKAKDDEIAKLLEALAKAEKEKENILLDTSDKQKAAEVAIKEEERKRKAAEKARIKAEAKKKEAAEKARIATGESQEALRLLEQKAEAERKALDDVREVERKQKQIIAEHKQIAEQEKQALKNKYFELSNTAQMLKQRANEELDGRDTELEAARRAIANKDAERVLLIAQLDEQKRQLNESIDITDKEKQQFILNHEKEKQQLLKINSLEKADLQRVHANLKKKLEKIARKE